MDRSKVQRFLIFSLVFCLIEFIAIERMAPNLAEILGALDIRQFFQDGVSGILIVFVLPTVPIMAALFLAYEAVRSFLLVGPLIIAARFIFGKHLREIHYLWCFPAAFLASCCCIYLNVFPVGSKNPPLYEGSFIFAALYFALVFVLVFSHAVFSIFLLELLDIARSKIAPGTPPPVPGKN